MAALLTEPFVAVGRKRVIDLLIVGGALAEAGPGRYLVRPLPPDAVSPVHQNTIRLLVERYVRQAIHGNALSTSIRRTGTLY